MADNCEIKDLLPQSAISIRTRTPVQNLPQVLGAAYQKIAQYLGELGETPAGAPFVAYFNMDMQDLDIEIGFPVSKPLLGKDDLQASAMPQGRVATILHVGPYTEISPAYQALTEFVTAGGHQPSGVAYEFYLNDPQQTPPQELQTQIVFPLVS